MPLAVGFRMGVALRTAAYRRGWLKTRRLNRPVVSVGNLSVGGTGKTPFVAFLAELLMKRGWKPGILTRGYGRRKGAKLVPIAQGDRRAPDPREVGDEPALLARKLPEVPIVVGADRFRAGLLAEEKFGVNVHILDDGFQHLALARDVDIVLLDSTQELSDDALLPAGRWREPLSALNRAHLVVITRTELADPQPLEIRLGDAKSRASIFRCLTTLKDLVDVASGKIASRESVGAARVHAFCGIGNPDAFFRNVEQWGFAVVATASFPDHHVFEPSDVSRLVAKAREASAKALITTEKDALNLPAVEKTEMPLWACVVQSEVHGANAFAEALFERLEAAKGSA